MTPEQRAKDIVTRWAGTDQSNQPLENLIVAVAADLQAARIEGLREALKLMRQANFYSEGVELILAEIAALERGKE